MAAQFLVRFDDICPTMNWRNWAPVEEALIKTGVKPLLAVVPDNCDPELRIAPADPAFWQRVRDWQQMGWSIAIHGYQHCYVSASAGILGRYPYSEFAGLPESVQRIKLQRALEIFRREGVRPEAFVAPGHSFDAVTVRLLKDLGIDCLSDGYSIYPYVCRQGMLWIPQQLGAFRSLSFGTWTVCQHVNQWIPRQIEHFRERITEFREEIVTLDDIRNSYRNRARAFSDQVFFNCFRTFRSRKA
jgi:predicted deacetylase